MESISRPNETWGAKIYEVVKYMSLCKLGQNPQVYVASPIFLEKLPPDLKAIVLKGMKEAAKWHTAKVDGRGLHGGYAGFEGERACRSTR